MSVWTWMLCLQERGGLNPKLVFEALEAIGMRADAAPCRIQLLDDGAVDIVEEGRVDGQSAADRVAAGEEIQTAYRDDNVYVSVERLISKTFDCVVFGWTEKLMGRAKEKKDYPSALIGAARAANAAIGITVVEPPDEWIGLVSLEAAICRVRATTTRGPKLDWFRIENLKTGKQRTFYPPHPDAVTFEF